MSMAVGCSPPAWTDGSPEDPLLKAIFSLEVSVPFSSGLEGILGTIQCTSGCRHFDKSQPGSRVLRGEVSLSESVEKYTTTCLRLEVFTGVARDQGHTVVPRVWGASLPWLGFITVGSSIRLSHPLAKVGVTMRPKLIIHREGKLFRIAGPRILLPN